jgi:hypothetical protein
MGLWTPGYPGSQEYLAGLSTAARTDKRLTVQASRAPFRAVHITGAGVIPITGA